MIYYDAEVFKKIDFIIADFKIWDSDIHKKATGCPNETILENLRYINAIGGKAEVRIPYVPDYNGSEIERIAAFLSELECITKVRVLPYHNYAASKYSALGMENTLPETLPTDEEIENAKQIFRKHSILVL